MDAGKPNKCPLAISSRRYLREKKAELLKMDDNRKSYNNFCRKHLNQKKRRLWQQRGEKLFQQGCFAIYPEQHTRSNTGPYGSQRPYKQRNFEWHVEGNIQAGAYFSPLTPQVTTLLHQSSFKQRQATKPDGERPWRPASPAVQGKGCISVDPYSKDKTVDKKRYSLGAGHGILFLTIIMSNHVSRPI